MWDFSMFFLTMISTKRSWRGKYPIFKNTKKVCTLSFLISFFKQLIQKSFFNKRLYSYLILLFHQFGLYVNISCYKTTRKTSEVENCGRQFYSVQSSLSMGLLFQSVGLSKSVPLLHPIDSNLFPSSHLSTWDFWLFIFPSTGYCLSFPW